MKKIILSFFFNVLLLTTLSATNNANITYPSMNWNTIRLTTLVDGIAHPIDYTITNQNNEISLRTNDDRDEVFRGTNLDFSPINNPVLYSLYPQYMGIKVHGPINITQHLHLEAGYSLNQALKALCSAGLIDKVSCVFTLTHPFYTHMRTLIQNKTVALMPLSREEKLTTIEENLANAIIGNADNEIAILNKKISEIEAEVKGW